MNSFVFKACCCSTLASWFSAFLKSRKTFIITTFSWLVTGLKWFKTVFCKGCFLVEDLVFLNTVSAFFFVLVRFFNGFVSLTKQFGLFDFRFPRADTTGLLVLLVVWERLIPGTPAPSPFDLPPTLSSSVFESRPSVSESSSSVSEKAAAQSFSLQTDRCVCKFWNTSFSQTATSMISVLLILTFLFEFKLKYFLSWRRNSAKKLYSLEDAS